MWMDTTRSWRSSLLPFPSAIQHSQVPELFKHRKRQSANLSLSVLKSLSSSLFQNLQASFWSSTSFKSLQDDTRVLAETLANYSDYLFSRNKVMKTIHAQPVPVRQLSDALSLKYVRPGQARSRYEYIERSGLSCPIMLLTYSSGNNSGNSPLHLESTCRKRSWWVLPMQSLSE